MEHNAVKLDKTKMTDKNLIRFFFFKFAYKEHITMGIQYYNSLIGRTCLECQSAKRKLLDFAFKDDFFYDT